MEASTSFIEQMNERIITLKNFQHHRWPYKFSLFKDTNSSHLPGSKFDGTVPFSLTSPEKSKLGLVFVA